MKIDGGIIKSNGSLSLNSIESRLHKIEQLFQSLISFSDNQTQNSTGESGSGLKNIVFMAQKTQNSQSVNDQVALNSIVSSGNINNKASKHIALSYGQIIAELASSIMRANQRNA